jgi:uncharacterized membrane protein YhaH (DUF805 family)
MKGDSMANQAATAGGGTDWKWLLLSIQGRIPRSTYWLKFFLPAVVLGIIANVLDSVLGTSSPEGYGGVISGLYGLVLIWPSIATGVKRLHDRDMSGWWMLIQLIPVIGFLFWLIVIGILKGTTGPNRFGPDPLGGTS